MVNAGPHKVPIRRILAPLDGAAPSEAVVPYVTGLTDALNARLILFRSARSDGEIGAAEDYLENVAAKLRESGMGVATHSAKGRASDSIVAAAETYEADLIAMTAHARAQGRHDLLGSTAHRVLEKCAIPVLVLRTIDRVWAKPPAVIVGLDGSEASHIAIEHAVGLAKSLDCELVMVRAVEPVTPLGGAARYYGTVDDFAQSYLDELKESLSGAGIAIRTYVGRRAPEQELLGVAGSRPGSIIVLSTSGLTGRPGIIGSTTDRVVRSQSHPVLAVPVH